MQMWAIKHNPDILLLQKTQCNRAKGKFLNLPGNRNFGNCLSQKYMTYLQKSKAAATGNKLTRPLNYSKIMAKWVTITLIKEELSDIAFDFTPAADLAKCRVYAVKLGKPISLINMPMFMPQQAGGNRKRGASTTT